MASPIIPAAATIMSRSSGTAPLAVFFDATGTTDDGTSNPYHDLDYLWYFGDGNVSNFSYGANTNLNRNRASEPMAAHVYETAGNYSWFLVVWDGSSASIRTGSITVTAANTTFSTTNTICVSTSGNFTGAPSGSTQVTASDFDATLVTYLTSGKRVLFCGGETFTGSTHTTFTGATAQVGSYGTGKAKINWTGTADNLGWLRVGSIASDFRVTDIEFDGTGTSGQTFMSFQNTAWVNVLILNSYIHNVSNYLNGVDWAGSGGSGFYVINNRFENPDPGSTTDMILVGSGSIVALIGNNLVQQNVGQQVVRLNAVNKYIVSNNTASGAATTKETIGIRSSDTETSTYGIVADNDITPGNGYVGIYASGANTSLGSFDIIYTRNYVHGSAGANSSAIACSAERVTIRNNVISVSDLDMSIGIALAGTNSGNTLPSKNTWVYNNTIYTSQVTGSFTGINVDTTASTGNIVTNNLIYSPGITATSVSDSGAVATKATNTVEGAGAGSVKTDPGFINTSFFTGFRLTSASGYPNTGGTASFPATKVDAFLGQSNNATIRRGAMVAQTIINMRGVGK